MEVIGVILFVVFMLISFGDKNKKTRQSQNQKAPGAAKNAAPAPKARASGPIRPVAPAGSDRASRFEQAMERLENKLNGVGEASQARQRSEPVVRAMDRAAVRQGEAMLDDADCHGGSMEHTHAEGRSALEDEDCMGGSMEHTHTEGVSRADHALRMAAIDANRDAEVLPETIDARVLRRAVVMAEVLGKPRAYRVRS